MTTEIRVPELGESVLEATVGQWLKAEGDRIQAGEPLVELETDKVNLEVGAEHPGILASIERKAGEDVAVGDVLGRIELSVADDDTEADGEHDREAEAARALQDGKGAESSVATQESVQQQDEMASKEAEPAAQAPAGHADSTRSPQTEGGQQQAATPVAQRMAEARDVDLALVVPGSGPGGRVQREDIERYLERRDADSQRKPKTSERSPHGPEPEEQPQVERVRMSRRRRTIAERLVEAQRNAAMLTTFNDVDMGAVLDLRRRRNPEFQERHGIKVGIVSFFVKAAVGALKEFPRMNAEIDGDEMLIKHFYDIGIAVGDPEGLVVPVLRAADRLSFPQIERQIGEFVERAAEGRLAIDDLRGGTFTITNGGIFGSLMSTPILNPPQVGVLGLHRFEDRPVVIDGQIEVRPMMYLALSYDHRIVDGREAVQFLARVKELVEDPERLLLEG